jgi:DNA polymerase III subunit gamma/tau
MRDGLSLADQAIAYGGGAFDEAVVRTMLGAVSGSVAADLVRALAQRDASAVLAGVGRLREGGLSAASTLEQMASLLQQMAVEQAVPGALPGDDSDVQAARELAPLLPPDETQLLYSIVLHGRAELALMSDEFAALTMVLLRFLAFPPAGSAAPAPPPIKAAPLRAAAPPAMAVPARPPVVLPAAPPAPAAAVAMAPAPMVREPSPAEWALGERWNTLVRKLIDSGAVSGLVRELAWQSALLSAEESNPATWQLRAAHESLGAQGLRDKLAEALGAELGRVVLLDVTVGPADDTPARREAAERARRQRQAEDTIRTDPVVQELMSQFKSARIVPGSIKPI